MAPNVDSLFATPNELISNAPAQCANEDSSLEHASPSQQELKYHAELQRLNKEKCELIEEKKGIEEIISSEYPDLPIAHSVRNDAGWRIDDEQRLRVRISLKRMNRKAKKMIADALEDRLSLERSIESSIRCNQAAIAAAHVGIKLCSRKRSAAPNEEEHMKRKRKEESSIDHASPSQQEVKYHAELQRLNKEKCELLEEKEGIEEIISSEYPDLPIAHSVRNDVGWRKRCRNEQRLRARISLKRMNRKAKKMIADALEDRLSLERSIDSSLRCNQAAIAAAHVGIKLCSRKRAAAPTEEEQVKRARFE